MIKIYICSDASEINYDSSKNVVEHSELKKLNFVVPNNDCLVQFTVSERYDAPNDNRILGICFFSIQVQ